MDFWKRHWRLTFRSYHYLIRSMTRRLAPLLLSTFVGGIALWIPVEKLFMSEIGFTPATVGLMAAAYAVVVPLLEILSGVLADRRSRVPVVGNVGALLSVLVGVSTNVTTYVAAALLLGVYFAMQSGTRSDWIDYDTVLEETGSSARFDAVLGRVQVLSSAALVLGAGRGPARGGHVAPYHLRRHPAVPRRLHRRLLRFREPQLHRTSGATTLRQHVTTTVCTLPLAAADRPDRGPARAHQAAQPGRLRVRTAMAGRGRGRHCRLRPCVGRADELDRPRRRDRRSGAARRPGTRPGGRQPAGRRGAAARQRRPGRRLGRAGRHRHGLRRLRRDGHLPAARLDCRPPSAPASRRASVPGVAVFLPFALAFGAISERFGVSAAGWLLVKPAPSPAGCW